MFMEYEYIISTFGFFINIFHLIILTQKSMRTSSINVILIGIACCDIYALFVPGAQKIDRMLQSWQVDWFPLVIEPAFCSQLPPSADRIFITLMVLGVRFAARRSSTWLSLSMAVIRTVVVTKSTSARVRTYTHPLFGVIVIVFTTIISSTFTVLHLVRQEIVQNGTFTVPDGCDGYPEGFIIPTYKLVSIPSFAQNNNFLNKLLISFDSVVSRVLPCLFFPIVTCLLIRELQKANDNRKKLSFSITDKTGGERTTKLVTYLTITFFIAEFPLGVLYVIQANILDQVFVSEISCIMDFFFLLLDANSTSHFFICLAMSSQYRNAVRSTLNMTQKHRVQSAQSAVTRPPLSTS